MAVAVDWHMMSALAIATWLIYTLDHLWDAQKVPGKTVNPRHAFHRQHAKIIIVFGGVAATIGIYNVFQLPRQTIISGLILGGLSMLYFVYLRWSKSNIQKAFFAALVYAAGIATAPVSLLSRFETNHFRLVAVFFMLAYANLLIIQLYEQELDKNDKPSLIMKLGARKVQIRILFALAVCFMLIVWVLEETGEAAVFFIVVGMILTLLIITLFPQRFRSFQLYRILSDGIFFLPSLYLLAFG